MVKIEQLTRPFLTFLLCLGIIAFEVSCKLEAKTSCYANLKMIHGAKDTYAIEHATTNGQQVTEKNLLIYMEAMPRCPQGGTYKIGAVGESPSCSLATHVYP